MIGATHKESVYTCTIKYNCLAKLYIWYGVYKTSQYKLWDTKDNIINVVGATHKESLYNGNTTLQLSVKLYDMEYINPRWKYNQFWNKSKITL
jgi:hypothetical protein